MAKRDSLAQATQICTIEIDLSWMNSFIPLYLVIRDNGSYKILKYYYDIAIV
jgi:hypothetical protein